jgi:hypothetical protein
MNIQLTMTALCWGDDYSQCDTIFAADLTISLASVENLTAWLTQHLQDAVREGAIDLGQVRREGNEIFARFRREKQEAESGRGAGRKRRVRQPRSGQAEDPDLPPPGSKP